MGDELNLRWIKLQFPRKIRPIHTARMAKCSKNRSLTIRRWFTIRWRNGFIEAPFIIGLIAIGIIISTKQRGSFRKCKFDSIIFSGHLVEISSFPLTCEMAIKLIESPSSLSVLFKFPSHRSKKIKKAQTWIEKEEEEELLVWCAKIQKYTQTADQSSPQIYPWSKNIIIFTLCPVGL